MLSWSSEFGSRNYLAACLSETATGAYVAYGKKARSSRLSNSSEGLALQRRLWRDVQDLWDDKTAQSGWQ